MSAGEIEPRDTHGARQIHEARHLDRDSRRQDMHGRGGCRRRREPLENLAGATVRGLRGVAGLAVLVRKIDDEERSDGADREQQREAMAG